MLPPAKQNTHTFSHMICPTAKMQLLALAIVSSCSSRSVMATWPNVTGLRHLHPAWDALSLSMSCSSGRSRDRHQSVQRCQRGAQRGRSEVAAFGSFCCNLWSLSTSYRLQVCFRLTYWTYWHWPYSFLFFFLHFSHFLYFLYIFLLDQAEAPRHGTKVTG